MLRIVKYAFLAIAPMALMGVLYLSLHGLPASWTRNIERQLQFSGMVVSLDKIRLGVFEGIIASRVRCHRLGDIGEPVFEAEKIVLRFDPRRWLKGEYGVTGGRIKNGVFRLPVGAGTHAAEAGAGSQALVFEELQAQAAWDRPTEICVQDFSTRLQGIHVTGRGTFLLPAPAAAPGAPGPGAAAQAGSRAGPLVFKVLRACRAARLNAALNAEIVFLADVSDIRKLELRVKLDSRDTRVDRSRAGAWRAQIDARGMAATGVLEIKDSAVQGIPVEKAVCRLVCDGQSLALDQLEAVVGRGAGKGRLALSLKYGWQSTEFEGRAESDMNLRSFLPLLRRDFPAHAWILEAFQFPGRPPRAQAAFRGRLQPEFSFKLDGRAHAWDMAYHDVSVSEARVGLAVEREGTRGVVVTLAPLSALRPEGSGQGWIRVDMDARAVSFDASSTLDPFAMAPMIDPVIDRLVRQFRFEGPLRSAGWGRVGFSDTTLDDMELMIEARNAGWSRFLADRCALNLHWLGDNMELTDIRGAIYGGNFDARACVCRMPGGAPMRYDAEADIREVDLSRMVEALALPSAEPFDGTLSAHVALEGAVGAGQGRTARGQGWVKIEDGRLFQIPLFGGLSDFLVRIVPGMRSLMRQTDGWASFVIGDGKIHADEILMEGDVFSLVGAGDYGLDGSLDFTVQVKLLRKDSLAADIFRFVTHPFSKLLEFHLGGTVAAPQWRPVHIPKEVFLIFD